MHLAYGFVILMFNMNRYEPSANHGGVVTGDATQRSNVRRKLLFGSAGLIVVIGLAAGGWYAWNHTSLLHQPQNNTNTPVDYNKLSPTVAIKAAQAAVDTATTSAEKSAAYSNLGQAYMRNNQPSQAASAFEQTVNQTGGSVSDVPNLSQLAYAYVAAGDKAKAIETLQQIIAIEKTSDQLQKDKIISRYEAEVSYLQGPPK